MTTWFYRNDKIGRRNDKIGRRNDKIGRRNDNDAFAGMTMMLSQE